MNDLGVSEFLMDGYTIQEWISDIKSKLEVLAQKNEESNLRMLESKLSMLLSEDKKTELELDAIANLLN
jgi:hypothetical protein